MSDKRVLFIVEGNETEKIIIQNISKKALSLVNDSYEIVVFGTCIYELYKNIMDDPYISLLDYLNETHALDFSKIITKNSFSQIYLVFDFEPNYQKYSDNDIIECLQFFNNETENGKLYISYPMIESIFYLDDFDNPKIDDYIKLEDCLGRIFKKHVRQITCYRNKKNVNFFYLIHVIYGILLNGIT